MLPGEQGNLCFWVVPAEVIIVQHCSGASKSSVSLSPCHLWGVGMFIRDENPIPELPTPTLMRLDINDDGHTPFTPSPNLETWEWSYLFSRCHFWLFFLSLAFIFISPLGFPWTSSYYLFSWPTFSQRPLPTGFLAQAASHLLFRVTILHTHWLNPLFLE